MRRERRWDRERAEGWNHYRTRQAALQRTENKTTIRYSTTTKICNHKVKWKHRKATQHTSISENTYYASFWQILLKIQNFLWKCIKIDNLWKSILHNLRYLFKICWWSDDQIPTLYNKKSRLKVIELLTTIKTSTKQTKNTSKIIDLRGRLKTADHCGAVLLFELNSLTYAFCSTSHFKSYSGFQFMCDIIYDDQLFHFHEIGDPSYGEPAVNRQPSFRRGDS